MQRILVLLAFAALCACPVATASAQFAPPEQRLVQRDFRFTGLDQIPDRTFVLTYQRRNLFRTKVVENDKPIEPFDRVIWPDGRGAPGVVLHAIKGDLPDEITSAWLRQADCITLAVNEKLDGVLNADPAQPQVVAEHVTYHITLTREGEGDDAKLALHIYTAKIVGIDGADAVVFTRTFNVPGRNDDDDSDDDDDGSADDDDDDAPGEDDQ